MDSGEKISETHYKNGELDGMSTSWHFELGVPFAGFSRKRETQFKNGEKHGFYKEWYKSCKKKVKGKYKYEDQYIKRLEFYIKKGKKEGVEKVWGICGKMESLKHYKNNVVDGVVTEWYESGRKKSLKHFKNGIENGVRKQWDEDGKLIYEGNFVDGAEEIK
jgi:antitoxin component YwqK of YwqJK toxin-antitoxin module